MSSVDFKVEIKFKELAHIAMSQGYSHADKTFLMYEIGEVERDFSDGSVDHDDVNSFYNMIIDNYT
ncbi:hypothetical protein KY330_00320 [Candidatus Woesearchaeota archaeon]|nr:hypothetical protein [Candidatus Woesearchaeota archaeon]